MADDAQTTNRWQSRDWLAYIVLFVSGVAITVLAWTAIYTKPTDSMQVFNIVLPVVASWVGTILAFYFGRENFEAANVQVREMIRKLTPEERAKSTVAEVMRRFAETEHVKIPAGRTDADVKVKDLRAKFSREITRLPVVQPNDSPKYMIHESSVDRFLSAGGKEEDTLEKFITDQKAAKFEFGTDKGFVVVAEAETVAGAKQKMEQTPYCLDIFVTKGGTDKEPLLGWISNVRLSKYLKG